MDKVKSSEDIHFLLWDVDMKLPHIFHDCKDLYILKTHWFNYYSTDYFFKTAYQVNWIEFFF